MSLYDLDIEFEDDADETKSAAVAKVPDIEYGTDSNISIPKPLVEVNTKPAPKPIFGPKTDPSMANKNSESNVRPISPKAAVPPVAPAPVQNATTAPTAKVATQVREKTLSGDQQLIRELQAKIDKIESESQIKIAVAEFKTNILSDLLSDIKLLEHQVGGVVNRIYTKHPDLKQEALMIKKILAEFSQKKRN